MKKPWFIAHKIKKMDPAYVVTAKFSDSARVFLSGLTTGEVKLWDNLTCEALCVVNSPDWNPAQIYNHWKETDQHTPML